MNRLWRQNLHIITREDAKVVVQVHGFLQVFGIFSRETPNRRSNSGTFYSTWEGCFQRNYASDKELTIAWRIYGKVNARAAPKAGSERSNGILLFVTRRFFTACVHCPVFTQVSITHA